MTFDEMIAAFVAAIRRSDLRTVPGPDVSLDQRSMDRTARFDLDPTRFSDRPSLHTGGHLSFRWSALDTARAHTSESDVVAQLLGPRTRLPQTAKRWLRLDIELSATTVWGKSLPDPGRSAWRAFRAELDGRLAGSPLVVDDAPATAVFLIRAWQGEPTATYTCGADGTLRLDAVRLAAWQALDVPRRLDTERVSDRAPDLDGVLARLEAGLAIWTDALRHLEPGGSTAGEA